MTVIEMRQCIRCGSSFRPFDFDQVCCSDFCSTTVQRLPLGPTAIAVVAKPVVPDRRVSPLRRPGSGRRPLFVGVRFVVFEWQIEQLSRLLGPLVNDFDLHEWFFTLDARVAQSPEVIPQRDGGQWLQARTLEEAQRRGLMVAASDADSAQSKQTSRLAQALASIKRGFQS